MGLAVWVVQLVQIGVGVDVLVGLGVLHAAGERRESSLRTQLAAGCWVTSKPCSVQTSDVKQEYDDVGGFRQGTHSLH